jgi:hypothetical protein
MDQARIAGLGTGAVGPVDTGGTVTWSGLTTTLTETGAAAFAGFFTAGTALDPLSFTVTTGTGGATGPSVTVEPSTTLPAEGATVTVTGSGFAPDANGGVGFYLAFGPKGAAYWTSSRPYQPVRWVHRNASSSSSQVMLAGDGTFRTTLDLDPTYTDGDGNPVDCTVTQCYLLTFAAHGSTDRSQDTATPITFGGGPGGPGGGGADQELSAQVLQSGPLTLTSAGTSVTLSAAHPGGVATGALHPVTVSDLRGSNAGWHLVGQVETFTSPLGGTIAADNLGWTPSAAPVDDGLVGAAGVVTPGGRATPGDGTGLGSARTLCGSAAGASAGTFRCDAALDLGLPAATAPGDYTATLTLTLS